MSIPNSDTEWSDVKISMGTATLGDSTKISDPEATSILEQAYQSGIRYFDTSALYGGGVAEERLGYFLDNFPNPDLRVTTKCGRYREYGAPPPHKGGTADCYDYGRDATLRSVERSLRRLGNDRLGLVFIHDPDAHLASALDGAYRVLQGLKSEGVIGGVGLATNQVSTAHDFLANETFDALMLANSFSLLAPFAAKSVLSCAKEQKAQVFIAGVFQSGILASGTRGNLQFIYNTASDDVVASVKALEGLCADYKVELNHAAMVFCARDPSVDFLTLGADSELQIKENVYCLTQPLPKCFWDDFAALISQLPHLKSLEPDHGH